MEGVKKMTTFESLEEAQEFFKADRFADINGVQLDKLEDDTCECSMELKDIHKNAYGGVMGGVIFTLGDFAFAVMSNHLHRPTVCKGFHQEKWQNLFNHQCRHKR